MNLKQIQSDITAIFLPELIEKQVSLFVKREDLLHPIISGNKYRKLAYNIEAAKRQGAETLVTFGGAYSNHVLATASAGAAFGFNTVAVIRGDELAINIEKTLASNPTLRAAKNLGMQFRFVTRSAYKLKDTEIFLKDLKREFPNGYILPEGGTNDLAVKGCESILNADDFKYDFIAVPVGTGGTISGIINSSDPSQKILGFPVLKGRGLKNEIEKNKVNKKNWELISSYHFGGYAKVSADLISFINDFYKHTEIPLDPIYTGKMFYGLVDLIKQDYFPVNSKVLVIHTGGIQGNRGMNVLLSKKGLPRLDL